MKASFEASPVVSFQTLSPDELAPVNPPVIRIFPPPIATVEGKIRCLKPSGGVRHVKPPSLVRTRDISVVRSCSTETSRRRPNQLGLLASFAYPSKVMMLSEPTGTDFKASSASPAASETVDEANSLPERSLTVTSIRSIDPRGEPPGKPEQFPVSAVATTPISP
ncbi:MAG: hypothetical protein BWX66_02067 [Deltaproteobacteria bacterium ADurb.Bin058]|nr:MAG: hypothetical protein BWX66_02067 [Deltaproteobacteria bacterium ADurb.Bin058]